MTKSNEAGHPPLSLTLATTLATTLAIAAAVTPATLCAQYVSVPPPAAYALQDVTVVHADGRRQEGVTLVVRGRLIEALGRDVQVPADARLLEGDSLVVYPGLVDGDGRSAHEFPRAEVDPRTIEIWNAPRSLQGFMPSRRVVSHLTSDGDALAPQRRAGLVAAAVHPTGAMMPGRGALLLYRQAATPQQLVIEPVLGPRFEFRGGPGVYPSTLFGVTAFMRQAFEDARHRSLISEAHARDPRGLTIPDHDADYAVLQQVQAGDLPVFFRANGATDILRALGLAAEYGFRPIVVGGHEAWKVADLLRQRNVPVLVDVDFPEPVRWHPADDEDGQEPLDAAAEREKLDLEARYANAARLAEAGIAFALTSGGSGELLRGARKAVEYGLSADAALAALTSSPATILGVPHLVRIEAGMPATFIVTSGPLFHDETEILHTFVEGLREEGSPPGVAPGEAEEAVDFAGEWDMRLVIGGQTMTAILNIEQDGATFVGSMSMMGERLPLRDGVIDVDQISTSVVVQQAGQTMTIRISGRVDGDRASGQAEAGPLGVAQWTATRRSPGGGR